MSCKASLNYVKPCLLLIKLLFFMMRDVFHFERIPKREKQWHKGREIVSRHPPTYFKGIESTSVRILIWETYSLLWMILILFLLNQDATVRSWLKSDCFMKPIQKWEWSEHVWSQVSVCQEVLLPSVFPFFHLHILHSSINATSIVIGNNSGNLVQKLS